MASMYLEEYFDYINEFRVIKVENGFIVQMHNKQFVFATKKALMNFVLEAAEYPKNGDL